MTKEIDNVKGNQEPDEVLLKSVDSLYSKRLKEAKNTLHTLEDHRVKSVSKRDQVVNLSNEVKDAREAAQSSLDSTYERLKKKLDFYYKRSVEELDQREHKLYQPYVKILDSLEEQISQIGRAKEMIRLKCDLESKQSFLQNFHLISLEVERCMQISDIEHVKPNLDGLYKELPLDVVNRATGSSFLKKMRHSQRSKINGTEEAIDQNFDKNPQNEYVNYSDMSSSDTTLSSATSKSSQQYKHWMSKESKYRKKCGKKPKGKKKPLKHHHVHHHLERSSKSNDKRKKSHKNKKKSLEMDDSDNDSNSTSSSATTSSSESTLSRERNEHIPRQKQHDMSKKELMRELSNSYKELEKLYQLARKNPSASKNAIHWESDPEKEESVWEDPVYVDVPDLNPAKEKKTPKCKKNKKKPYSKQVMEGYLSQEMDRLKQTLYDRISRMEDYVTQENQDDFEQPEKEPKLTRQSLEALAEEKGTWLNIRNFLYFVSTLFCYNLQTQTIDADSIQALEEDSDL
eukprot:gb/GECH01010510.1/.p1 GENE.gb/GECH01010510.1/~~gb/GECH01010510.1/.p1  ORF type:complete len:514 (+),score=112.99 gb/GECH01010510.1/:1-1542(+)